MESATEGFVLYDSELNLIEINKKALEIFPVGTTKEDVIGKNILEISPGLEKTERYDSYYEVIKTGKSLYFDDIVPVPKFGNRHLSVTAFRVGKGLGLIFTDITERKKAENDLKESEERFKQLIKNSFDMIVLLDSTGIQHFVSDSCEKILGYQSEELINIPVIEQLIHPDDQERAISGLQNILNTGSGNAQYRHRHKSGGWVYLEAFGTNQINNPYINSVILNVRDITERKKAEEALKNAAKEKGILLKEAHHRIKNNFSLVSSLLRMQLVKIKDPDDLEIFKESQNRVLIMARLHEVLHQTEIIGKVNMKVYLTKIIDNLCDSFRADANRIKVKSNIDELELNSKTATSCGLIVNELFTNAYKYGFPDGRKGEINITMRSLKGNEIELIVTDNGVSLPKKVDFRDPETLGLHLVKILAEDQLHGEVKLYRTKGTTFQIRLKVK